MNAQRLGKSAPKFDVQKINNSKWPRPIEEPEKLWNMKHRSGVEKRNA